VNEERTDFARVGVGDLVAVGTTRFVVEVADDADAPSFEPGGEAMACRLEIDGRTTTVRDGIRLIGSAPYCDIPVEGHGEAVLAVLAPKDRRWLLYALDGPGSPTEPIWQALREGTDYRVGTHTATVELLAEYELTDDEPPRSPFRAKRSAGRRRRRSTSRRRPPTTRPRPATANTPVGCSRG
jgi:hypothetical protein